MTIIISERQLKLIQDILYVENIAKSLNIDIGSLLQENSELLLENKLLLTERQNWLKSVDESIVFDYKENIEPSLNGFTSVKKIGDQEKFVSNKNPNNIIYRKISNTIGEKGTGIPSKYYKIREEMVIRGSDHWTYYIIPNYTFQYKDLYNNMVSKTSNLIFGSQDEIQGSVKYLLKLNTSFKKLVNPADVIERMIPPTLGAAKTVEGEYEFIRGGESFIILEKHSLGLFEKKYIWGQCTKREYFNTIMSINI